MVEQRIRNAQVACSSHVSSSIKSRLFFKRLFIFAQNGKTIVFDADLMYNDIYKDRLHFDIRGVWSHEDIYNDRRFGRRR